jgi:hypothetical protein
MSTSDARLKYVVKMVAKDGRGTNVRRLNGNVASLVGRSEAERYAKRCAKLQPNYTFYIVREYV